MDLTDLRVFAQVAADGSFSRAAAALYLAQAAVSRRIALLEAELGAPLCVRGGRRLTLTNAGKTLLPYAIRSLRLVEEGRERARAAHDVWSLSLAAPASIAPHVFPTVVAAALRGAPMDVACRTAHTSEVKQMVLDGAADAGFVLAGPASSGLRLRTLHRDPVLAVAARGHLLTVRESLRVQDLCAHPIVFFTWGPGYLEALEMFQRNGAQGMGRREVSPAAVAHALVLKHGYVSFLPRLTVQPDLQAGTLVALPVRDLPSWTWDIAVVYRRRKKPQRPLAYLLQALDSINWTGSAITASAGPPPVTRRRLTVARLARRLPSRR